PRARDHAHAGRPRGGAHAPHARQDRPRRRDPRGRARRAPRHHRRDGVVVDRRPRPPLQGLDGRHPRELSRAGARRRDRRGAHLAAERRDLPEPGDGERAGLGAGGRDRDGHVPDRRALTQGTPGSGASGMRPHANAGLRYQVTLCNPTTTTTTTTVPGATSTTTTTLPGGGAQTLSGTMLLLKDGAPQRRQLVMISKDRSFTSAGPGTADDPTLFGG